MTLSIEDIQTKKDPDIQGLYWRRRESNPRPKGPNPGIYKFSSLIFLFGKSYAKEPTYFLYISTIISFLAAEQH